FSAFWFHKAATASDCMEGSGRGEVSRRALPSRLSRAYPLPGELDALPVEELARVAIAQGLDHPAHAGDRVDRLERGSRAAHVRRDPARVDHDRDHAPREVVAERAVDHVEG